MTAPAALSDVCAAIALTSWNTDLSNWPVEISRLLGKIAALLAPEMA